MNESLLHANCWGTEEQKLLLKAALLTGEAALAAWKRWQELKGADFDNIEYASYTLLPLVSRNMAPLVKDDALLDRCKGIYRRNWAFNHLLWRKTLPVLRKLQSAGIDKIVLLKGMAMIVNYYRDFGVRVVGDVDMLIPKDQVEQAVNILLQSGWKANVPRFEPQMLAWHAADFKLDADTNLDLHWSLMFESVRDVDVMILRDAEQVAVTNLKLYVPNATDLLMQTCVHGVKSSPVPLIRWICDAMTILQQSRESVDWNRIIRFANRAQFTSPLIAAFRYLNDNFAADIPDQVIRQLDQTPSSRLERWENWSKKHDFYIGKSWTRFCLQRGYTTVWQQIIHTPRYLQDAGRLRYKWQIPFYSVYWVMKRIYRLCTGRRLNV